jgi:hypothetical protein
MLAPQKRSVAGESGTSYRRVVRAEYEASRNRVLVNIDRHVFSPVNLVEALMRSVDWSSDIRLLR